MMLAFAGCLSACSGGYPTEQHLLGNHQVDRHRNMPYLLWLPDGFDDSRAYPMIVSLHGTGPTAYTPEFVMQHGLPAVLAQDDQPEGFDFVVLAPQGLDGVDWWSTGQPEEVNEIVDDIVAELSIDPDRVYLTGFSTGGQGAWHLAARYPDRYAAVVSVAGSGFRSSGGVSEASCELSSVPIWSLHGENDLIAVHDIIRAEVSEWEALCDSEIMWTTLSGMGHYESFESAYRDPEIYAWLEEQTG
jgi:predicted peptidase